MLVRKAKPNFDCLLEAAKQLVVWTFHHKGFHSTCQNDYYSGRRNFRPPQHKRKFDLPSASDFCEKLKPEDLKHFEKNFYTPHPNVVNRSESEVKDFYDRHDIQLFGRGHTKCPTAIFSFDELDLPTEARDVIRHLNYTEPTPIQSQTWPIALSGLNMVGVAQTGSGKTLGFVLPGLIHIKHQPELERGDGPIALVLSPTRELAQQIDKVILPFASSFSFHSACVFGGASKIVQGDRLRGAHVCVGTPGRVIDFLNTNILNLRRCTYFVLDEADRLLDMGFEPQIRTIMSRMRPDSQMLMWSATWPKEVKDLASDFLNDFVGVKFGSSELIASSNITQNVHICSEFDKRNLLLELLREISEDEKTLIYSRKKTGVEYLQSWLRRNGFRSMFLHGDKSQRERDRAIQSFREGSSKILVGTAVVCRGLDITDIKNVIVYDFPEDLEDYIHAIGRTGRHNKEGTSHLFLTEAEGKFAKPLIRLLNQTNQTVSPELEALANNYREEPKRKAFHRGWRDFGSYNNTRRYRNW